MILPCTVSVWSYIYRLQAEVFMKSWVCRRVCVCLCFSVRRLSCCSLDNHWNSTVKHTCARTHTDYLVQREYKPSMERQYTCKRLPRRDGWCYTDLRADRRRSLTFECKNVSLWRTWNASSFGRDLAFRKRTRTNPKGQQSVDLYAALIVRYDHDICFGCSIRGTHIRNIQRSCLSLILLPVISQAVLSNKAAKGQRNTLKKKKEKYSSLFLCVWPWRQIHSLSSIEIVWHFVK